MSQANPAPSAMEMLAASEEGHDQGHHAHLPHLAHHFDTPEQQYMTGKIGMWVFLGTEILMFGGLFLAYAVYRYNYPEVFVYAASDSVQLLSKSMGATNTVVLLASSLTMALAVRFAQLNRQRALVTCLALTLLGGAGFMVIKALEYEHKSHENVWVGPRNKYRADYTGEGAMLADNPAATGAAATAGGGGQTSDPQAPPAPTIEAATTADPRSQPGWIDPNAGTTDAAKIQPNYVAPAGLAAAEQHLTSHEPDWATLEQRAKSRVYTFFQIYFLMTGLHGIHVIIGMSLIFWILLRSVGRPTRNWLIGVVPIAVGAYVIFVALIAHLQTTLIVGAVIAGLGVLATIALFLRSRKVKRAHGEFSSHYFTPVDIVGLYWHVVDLIWIFLFPLLYLIH